MNDNDIDIPDQTGQPKLSPFSQTFSRLSEKLPTKTITKTAIFQESQAGQLLMTHLHALAAFGTSVASVLCREEEFASRDSLHFSPCLSLSLYLSVDNRHLSRYWANQSRAAMHAFIIFATCVECHRQHLLTIFNDHIENREHLGWYRSQIGPQNFGIKRLASHYLFGLCFTSWVCLKIVYP